MFAYDRTPVLMEDAARQGDQPEARTKKGAGTVDDPDVRVDGALAEASPTLQ